MPYTYFISDLHLCADRPDITRCLLAFLQDKAPRADALYVLGDLFEMWIGDDDNNVFTMEVAQAFKALADKGVAMYFIHGNRDFLIRSPFAQRAGFTLLAEQCVVDLYGRSTLIMHGDELCIADLEYQQFRKKARGWWWPRLMLSLPLSLRRKIAEKGRKTSQANQQKLSLEIMDVSQSEVVKVMHEHKVTRLIHGHTHRPAIHDLEVDGHQAQRIVLGDWYEQGSILKVTADSVDLQNKAFQ
ncbi:MAG: UDP-2,3-diacylglucosamine hydrolase [Paraglaciecola sp.]|jgi:UDP-2,3-diacylglucosamine hydrolase